VILKLSTTPLRRCSPKGLNIMSLNPYTGNITFKYLWFRRGLRYSFRMGEECGVAHTDSNKKTRWVYEHLKTQMLLNTCRSFMTNMLLSPS
jgi:hypothetical protein